MNVVFTPSVVTSGHLTPHIRPPPTDAPATRSSSRHVHTEIDVKRYTFFTQQLHSSSYLAFDCCYVFPSQHVVVIAPYELSGTWSQVVLQSCHVCSRLTPSRSASYRPLATSLSLFRTLLISLWQTQSQHFPLVDPQLHCVTNVSHSSLKREMLYLELTTQDLYDPDYAAHRVVRVTKRRTVHRSSSHLSWYAKWTEYVNLTSN